MLTLIDFAHSLFQDGVFTRTRFVFIVLSCKLILTWNIGILIQYSLIIKCFRLKVLIESICISPVEFLEVYDDETSFLVPIFDYLAPEDIRKTKKQYHSKNMPNQMYFLFQELDVVQAKLCITKKVESDL